jgi:CCR4-NOT transcriptional regulation complex NOT5 subunit
LENQQKESFIKPHNSYNNFLDREIFSSSSDLSDCSEGISQIAQVFHPEHCLAGLSVKADPPIDLGFA